MRCLDYSNNRLNDMTPEDIQLCIGWKAVIKNRGFFQGMPWSRQFVEYIVSKYTEEAIYKAEPIVSPRTLKS